MTDFATLGMDIDSSGLTDGQRELRRLEDAGARAEQRLGRSSDVMAAGFRGMARAAGSLAGAIAAAFSFRAVVSTLSEFETAMSRVAAVSGATGMQLQQLRETAMELGRTTEFSAGQAADALGFLSMAGFEASESMAAIPAVLDLATASGMDLASTADIASNVLSGFGIAATEAGRAADVLAEAASATNTNVSQLGQAMSTAAPIAASLGISMEETAAAIGVMSDAGIQGERAGTALRGVFASLAGPTTQARDALAQYGLTAADVNPETNDLADVLDLLRERGLSTADAMTIFGREAASGALVMIDTAERVRDLTTQFEGATGAATQMAGVMRDNLGGDLAGLRSALEGLIISLGDSGVTGALRSVTQALTEMVRFGSENIGLVVGAVTALGVVLAALGAPFIGIGIAIGGIVTGVVVMVSRIREAFGTLGNAMTAVRDVISEVFDRINTRMVAWQTATAATIETVKGTFYSIAETAATAMSSAIGAVAQGAQGLVNTAASAIESMINTVISGVNVLIEGLNQLPGVAMATLAPFAAGRADFSGATGGVDALTERMTALRGEADANANSLSGLATLLTDLAGQPLDSVEAIRAAFRGEAFGGRSRGAGGSIVGPDGTSIPFEAGGGTGTGTGAGADGGGGGGSGEDPMTALQALLGTDDPRAEIELWYSEAMTALAEAQLIERGLHEEHAAYRLRIEELYQDQLMALRRRQADENLGHYESFFGTMEGVFQSGSERMLGISRAFGLAEAAISIWRGAARALERPFPANLAAWAQVLATGAKALQGIKSAKPGNATLGGGGGGQAAAVPARPTQNVVIDMVNASAGQISQVQNLVDLMTEASRQGYDLNALVRGR